MMKGTRLKLLTFSLVLKSPIKTAYICIHCRNKIK
jgi:hypothetical protein